MSATNLKKKGRDRGLKFKAMIDVAFSGDHKTVRRHFRVFCDVPRSRKYQPLLNCGFLIFYCCVDSDHLIDSKYGILNR